VIELRMTDSVVNVSIGTAAVLGLIEVPMTVAPTTAYLMLGGRCLMNCAFCAQARESQAGALHLSRVTWPEFKLADVLDRLPRAVTRGNIHRACLQVTVSADSFEQTLNIVRAVKAVSGLPFDVAILPRDIAQVRQLLDAGVDHIGFGLDAACERVFRRVKGGSWAKALSLVEETAHAFPSRGAVHLIVGLGETEREMVERIQWAHDRGLTVGLFAFTPVRGTHLADRSPPHLATYRRMQAARWLMVHGWVRVEQMTFGAGDRLVQFGVPVSIDAEAFRTSGCPDCNRPYYNEQPSGPLYNYPRPLTAGEAAQAILEMEVKVQC
jgi:biotin synthase